MVARSPRTGKIMSAPSVCDASSPSSPESIEVRRADGVNVASAPLSAAT